MSHAEVRGIGINVMSVMDQCNECYKDEEQGLDMDKKCQVE